MDAETTCRKIADELGITIAITDCGHRLAEGATLKGHKFFTKEAYYFEDRGEDGEAYVRMFPIVKQWLAEYYQPPVTASSLDLKRFISELVFTWTRDGKHDVNDPTLPDYILWELRSTLEFPDGAIKHTDAVTSSPGTAAARWEFAQKIVDRFIAGERPKPETGKMAVPGQPDQSVTVHRTPSKQE